MRNIDMDTTNIRRAGRREFLGAAGSLAAASLIGGTTAPAEAQGASAATGATDVPVTGRRRLGTLEVSSVGIGVQNMSRTTRRRCRTALR